VTYYLLCLTVSNKFIFNTTVWKALKKSDVSTTVEIGTVEATSTAVQHTSPLRYTW